MKASPAAAFVLVLVMGLPIVWLGQAALVSSVSGSNGFAASMLPTALRETIVLMASVGVITASVGLLAAWLVTHFEFPLRRVLDWALILPLAVPTYLAAYTWVEFWGFTGPIQQVVRTLNGAETLREYWFPDIRSGWGASIVLASVLYPYVYVACRAFFLMQSTTLEIAARTLGANRWRTFFEVTLPLSRPPIVVGASLSMMEVVNDLGAVQYFGVNSLTAIIYTTWINRSDFGAAAQLAVAIVTIIGLLILLERWARRDRVYQGQRDSRVPPVRERLRGGRAIAASGSMLALLGLGFGIPFGNLAYLALRRITPEGLDMALSALWPTLLLGTTGAIATVGIGLLAARMGQKSKTQHRAISFATLGYAIPGTVLALGLLQPLGQADLWFNRFTMAVMDWRPGLVLSGSMVALVYVYAIRFLAISHGTLDAAIHKRGDNMLQAGRVLGARPLRLFLSIDLPTLSPALLSAAVLVFVEIVKELPATLLLRPIGMDTLATVVYSHANVSLFANAALPALFIVLAGLVPVILATQFGLDRKQMR